MINDKKVLQFFYKNADSLIETLHRNMKELKEDDELREITTEDQLKEAINKLKVKYKNIKIDESEKQDK